MKTYFKGNFVKKSWHKIVIVVILLCLLLASLTVYAAYQVYNNNLHAVNSSNNTEIVVAIPAGTSVDEISQILKTKNLIKATWAFKRYVASKELSDSLKAGTYRFKQSQSVASIVNDLVGGKVATELFTIFPAQRIDQIRQEFIDKGFAALAVDKALEPGNYVDHPALVDKPKSASLEGYLYPDSYQRVAETTPEIIIRAALDEMAKALTPDVRTSIAQQGLSVYQGIIIASIVEQEIPSEPLAPKADRRQAAQVFLKRIKSGIELGSDVTAFYGSEIAGQGKSVTYDTPYNTRLHTGFPPTPIGNVTSDGLDSIAFPASTDYLFFVAGDDHVTYFSKTLEEHQANVNAHCKVSCN